MYAWKQVPGCWSEVSSGPETQIHKAIMNKWHKHAIGLFTPRLRSSRPGVLRKFLHHLQFVGIPCIAAGQQHACFFENVSVDTKCPA